MTSTSQLQNRTLSIFSFHTCTFQCVSLKQALSLALSRSFSLNKAKDKIEPRTEEDKPDKEASFERKLEKSTRSWNFSFQSNHFLGMWAMINGLDGNLSLVGESTKVGPFNQGLWETIMLLIVPCLHYLSPTVMPLPEFSSVKDFTGLVGSKVGGASRLLYCLFIIVVFPEFCHLV